MIVFITTGQTPTSSERREAAERREAEKLKLAVAERIRFDSLCSIRLHCFAHSEAR